MIAVDTSALIAILGREPDWQPLLRALSQDASPMISALVSYETRVVCSTRRGLANLEDLDQLLATDNVQSVPFDDAAITSAHAAYMKYGKGRHPAGLNLCDCASYALAKEPRYSAAVQGQ